MPRDAASPRLFSGTMRLYGPASRLPADTGTWREAYPDGILGSTLGSTLGALFRRNARTGVCCFRRRASRAGFSFEATPGKLSKTVVPINHSIELRPDAESLALPGVEVIDIEVREPTVRLTLNAITPRLLPSPPRRHGACRRARPALQRCISAKLRTVFERSAGMAAARATTTTPCCAAA